MIDFKIKGTSLPLITKDTEYRCIDWGDLKNSFLFYDKINYISFGYKKYNNEIYILAERKEYTGNDFYMYKESDIIKLAKEQGMMQEKLIHGNWYEGTLGSDKWIIKFDNFKTKEYINVIKSICLESNNKFNNGYIDILENIKPANMEEVYKFFPEEKAFVLPEKWYIKITYENLSIVKDWLGVNNFNLGEWSCVYYNKECSDIDNRESYGYGDCSEITIEEFKKYVLKMENKKEIIGYKLIKPEYKEAAQKIVASSCWWRDSSKYGYDLGISENISIPRLESAGVLDLWFEPIYAPDKPKEEFYDMGSFTLNITKEGIFHNNHRKENITEYVKKLNSTINSLPSTLCNYSFCINTETLEFYKTGCEKNITKFKDWKKILEIYNNFQ